MCLPVSPLTITLLQVNLPESAVQAARHKIVISFPDYSHQDQVTVNTTISRALPYILPHPLRKQIVIIHHIQQFHSYFLV